MAITSAVCNSWKRDLGIAAFNHTNGTGHTFKTALYTSAATLSKATTAYSATNEISGTGYVAAGTAVAPATPVLSTDTVVFDWADASWAGATFTARGCLLYDDTHASDASVFVLDFGGDQSVTAGTFTIQWPTADATSAIIRIT